MARPVSKIPPVLIAAPVMPLIIERIGAHFPVLKLYEQANPEVTLKELQSTLRASVAGYDGPHFVESFIARFPKLEIISSFGVGYDHIDAEAAHRHGVVVTNTPDVLTDEVADLAIGLLIATTRRIPQAEHHLRRGHWLEKGSFPLSDTLRGKSMGVVGLGRIGKAIAKRGRAFGLKIAYHGRRPQAGVRYRYYPDLVEMARAVDILMLVTPGGIETRQLINSQVLEALGPKGTLINVARGSVVDEVALVAALQSGKLGAAGLDVFEVEPCLPKELSVMNNVVLLPHIASASQHTRDLMAGLVADNIVSWLKGRGPKTPVQETPWAKPE